MTAGRRRAALRPPPGRRDHRRTACAPGLPGADRPERVSHAGGAAQATFTGEAPAARAPEPAPVEREPGPVELLLDRIAEVCEARHERARIRRFDRPSVVTHPRGRVRPADDDRRARGRADRRRSRPFRPAGARAPTSPPSWSTRGRARARSLRDEAHAQRRAAAQLHRVPGPAGPVRLCRRADRPAHHRPPLPARACTSRSATATSTAPGQQVRRGPGRRAARLLAADHGRFLLLLGDFGHGKTFALRELARRHPDRAPAPDRRS